LRGTAARVDRTPRALREAGRARSISSKMTATCVWHCRAVDRTPRALREAGRARSISSKMTATCVWHCRALIERLARCARPDARD
jgi:hypothetical protein